MLTGGNNVVESFLVGGFGDKTNGRFFFVTGNLWPTWNAYAIVEEVLKTKLETKLPQKSEPLR